MQPSLCSSLILKTLQQFEARFALDLLDELEDKFSILTDPLELVLNSRSPMLGTLGFLEKSVGVLFEVKVGLQRNFNEVAFVVVGFEFRCSGLQEIAIGQNQLALRLELSCSFGRIGSLLKFVGSPTLGPTKPD